MNLSAAIGLQSEGRSIQAKGLKQDTRFQPVHAGAHAHFTKVGYIHTGNKVRGGVTTSNYFKTKGGNSRHVAVQADGSFMKTSRTAKGEKRNKGKLDAKGMKCGIQADWTKWNEEHPREPTGRSASVGKKDQALASQHSQLAFMHEHAANVAKQSGDKKASAAHIALSRDHAAAYHALYDKSDTNRYSKSDNALQRSSAMGVALPKTK
jgi:hypothetical protein